MAYLKFNVFERSPVNLSALIVVVTGDGGFGEGVRLPPPPPRGEVGYSTFLGEGGECLALFKAVCVCGEVGCD